MYITSSLTVKILLTGIQSDIPEPYERTRMSQKFVEGLGILGSHNALSSWLR